MPDPGEDAAADRPAPISPAAMQTAADRIETMMRSAQACEPASFSSVLGSEAVQVELLAILAQLEPERIIPILHSLAVGHPKNGREVLEALLDASRTGPGQYLHRILKILHRRALLARVFHRDRVQALRRACRSPVQEHA